MNFRITLCVISIGALLAAGCGGSKTTAASAEVSKLEETAIIFAQPYVTKLDKIIYRITTDFPYRKVMLSASAPQLLTLVDESGKASIFRLSGNAHVKRKDGEELSSDQSESLLKLLAFLEEKNLNGFIFYGNAEAVIIYIKPNLTLHYIGNEAGNAVRANYIKKAADKYDYRGDFCLSLSSEIFLCSERR